MHMRKCDANLLVISRVVFFSNLIGAAGAAFADEIAIPGTSVSVNAPDGFTTSSSFSGLENLQSGSSITVTELPAEAYEQLSAAFVDLEAAIEGYAQRGVSIERSATYVVGDQRIPVLIGRQQSSAGEFGKYIALLRGETTVLLTFNVLDSRALTPAVVEETVKSVRLERPATLEEKVEQLPFTFDVVPPFRISDVLLGSTVVLATVEGPDPTGLKPVVIVTRALSAVPPSSNASVGSQQVLRGTRGFESADITVSETVEFAGGQATYLEAIAGNREIVQFLRLPPDGVYIRLVAYGVTAELDRVMPAVTEIAHSVAIP